MNKIVIDGETIRLKDNVTKEELKEKLAGLGIIPYNPFDVEKTDKAYVIKYGFNVVKENIIREYDIEYGIPCKDEEIMKKVAKQEHLNRLLLKFTYDNDCVVSEEEMKDSNIKKWYIKYNNELKKYASAYVQYILPINTQFFKTEELCRRAIDEIVIPFMEINNLK